MVLIYSACLWWLVLAVPFTTPGLMPAPPGGDDRTHPPPFMINPLYNTAFLPPTHQPPPGTGHPSPPPPTNTTTTENTLRGGNRWAGDSIPDTPHREGENASEVKELRAALAELQSDMARFKGSFQSLLAEVGQAMEGCVERLKKFEERMANSGSGGRGNAGGGPDEART